MPSGAGVIIDWFGLGNSEAGGMHGADIAVLQRNSSAAAGWRLLDMFSTEEGLPTVDAKQDKQLISIMVSTEQQVNPAFC
jgi:hypothetical protein